MSSFEKIIRPFLLPDSAPSRRVVTSETANSDNAILRVTGKGQLKTYQINYSHSFSCYMTKQERETTEGTGDTGGGSVGTDPFDTRNPFTG